MKVQPPPHSKRIQHARIQGVVYRPKGTQKSLVVAACLESSIELHGIVQKPICSFMQECIETYPSVVAALSLPDLAHIGTIHPLLRDHGVNYGNSENPTEQHPVIRFTGRSHAEITAMATAAVIRRMNELTNQRPAGQKTAVLATPAWNSYYTDGEEDHEIDAKKQGFALSLLEHYKKEVGKGRTSSLVRRDVMPVFQRRLVELKKVEPSFDPQAVQQPTAMAKSQRITRVQAQLRQNEKECQEDEDQDDEEWTDEFTAALSTGMPSSIGSRIKVEGTAAMVAPPGSLQVMFPNPSNATARDASRRSSSAPFKAAAAVSNASSATNETSTEPDRRGNHPTVPQLAQSTLEPIRRASSHTSLRQSDPDIIVLDEIKDTNIEDSKPSKRKIDEVSTDPPIPSGPSLAAMVGQFAAYAGNDRTRFEERLQDLAETTQITRMMSASKDIRRILRWAIARHEGVVLQQEGVLRSMQDAYGADDIKTQEGVVQIFKMKLTRLNEAVEDFTAELDKLR